MENNETFGMSCELSICEFYGLDHKISESRVSRQKTDWIKTILPSFPFQIVKHEGGSSKTDFFVQSNEDGEIQTLSVKSNKKNYLVCPQIMGQKSKKGFCEYFQVPSVDDPNLSIQSKIKQWIYNNPKIWLMEAFKNLSCCDYLLWISLKGYAHLYEKQKMLEKSYTIDFERVVWKNSIEKWNESNVLKYNGKTIVEVQIHNKRDTIKFRIDLRFFGGHFPRKKPNSSDCNDPKKMNRKQLIEYFVKQNIEIPKLLKKKKDLLIYLSEKEKPIVHQIPDVDYEEKLQYENKNEEQETLGRNRC